MTLFQNSKADRDSADFEVVDRRYPTVWPSLLLTEEGAHLVEMLRIFAG